MKRSRSRTWLLIALSLAVGFSTNSSKASDEKDVKEIGSLKVAHRSIVPEEREIAIGNQLASEVDRSAKLIKDPVITEYVNRVAQNLAHNSDLKIPLTVKVIDDP